MVLSILAMDEISVQFRVGAPYYMRDDTRFYRRTLAVNLFQFLLIRRWWRLKGLTRGSLLDIGNNTRNVFNVVGLITHMAKLPVRDGFESRMLH